VWWVIVAEHGANITRRSPLDGEVVALFGGDELYDLSVGNYRDSEAIDFRHA
jgi:hypothetical protein